MINRFEALKSLRPNAEFIVVDDDFNAIECLSDNVAIPSLAQIDAEVKRLSEIEAQKPIQKAALLERLGITEDEARLLLS